MKFPILLPVSATSIAPPGAAFAGPGDRLCGHFAPTL
jgi:hypothetical protein